MLDVDEQGEGWGVLKIRQFYGRHMCIVRNVKQFMDNSSQLYRSIPTYFKRNKDNIVIMRKL